MKRVKTLVLVLIGAAGLYGCHSGAPMQVGAATSQHTVGETDPFLKELAAVPVDKRRAYFKSHQAQVKAIRGKIKTEPGLIQHLQQIMKGVPQ